MWFLSIKIKSLVLDPHYFHFYSNKYISVKNLMTHTEKVLNEFWMRICANLLHRHTLQVRDETEEVRWRRFPVKSSWHRTCNWSFPTHIHPKKESRIVLDEYTLVAICWRMIVNCVPEEYCVLLHKLHSSKLLPVPVEVPNYEHRSRRSKMCISQRGSPPNYMSCRGF